MEKIPESENVTFHDLFPPTFMEEFTAFATIQEFIDALEVIPGEKPDFHSTPESIKDSFVEDNTQFPNWEDMAGTAAEQRMLKQMGLDES